MSGKFQTITILIPCYRYDLRDFTVKNEILFKKRQLNEIPKKYKEDVEPLASPKQVLMEFSQESTFYGIRYIARDGAGLFER